MPQPLQKFNNLANSWRTASELIRDLRINLDFLQKLILSPNRYTVLVRSANSSLLARFTDNGILSNLFSVIICNRITCKDLDVSTAAIGTSSSTHTLSSANRMDVAYLGMLANVNISPHSRVEDILNYAVRQLRAIESRLNISGVFSLLIELAADPEYDLVDIQRLLTKDFEPLLTRMLTKLYLILSLAIGDSGVIRSGEASNLLRYVRLHKADMLDIDSLEYMLIEADEGRASVQYLVKFISGLSKLDEYFKITPFFKNFYNFKITYMNVAEYDIQAASELFKMADIDKMQASIVNPGDLRLSSSDYIQNLRRVLMESGNTLGCRVNMQFLIACVDAGIDLAPLVQQLNLDRVCSDTSNMDVFQRHLYHMLKSTLPRSPAMFGDTQAPSDESRRIRVRRRHTEISAADTGDDQSQIKRKRGFGSGSK